MKGALNEAVYLCWLLVLNFAIAQQEIPQEVEVGARFVQHIVTSKSIADITAFKSAKIQLEPTSQKKLAQIRSDVQRFAQRRKLDDEILAYEQEIIAIDQGNQKIIYRISDEIGDVLFVKVHILHKVEPPTITEVELITPKEATNRKKGFIIKNKAQ